MQETIKKVEMAVKELLTGEGTGHDWYHIKQVRDMALRIAAIEGGDKELIELAALAHDVGDRKFYPTPEAGEAATRELLQRCGVSAEMTEKVMDIVDRVSFKGARVQDDMSTLEGKIVQDADRLYALGAIGVARCFAYGGSKGRPLYNPEEKLLQATDVEQYYKNVTSSLAHFQEKLFHLKERIHTKTARTIAEERDAYLHDFYDRFMAEWEAKD